MLLSSLRNPGCWGHIQIPGLWLYPHLHMRGNCPSSSTTLGRGTGLGPELQPASSFPQTPPSSVARARPGNRPGGSPNIDPGSEEALGGSGRS